MRVILIGLIALSATSCSKNKKACWQCIENTNKRDNGSLSFSDTTQFCDKTKAEAEEYANTKELNYNGQNPNSIYVLEIDCEKQ